MHVFVVVAVGLAAVILHAPKAAAHTCTTPRAAVGMRLQITNAQNQTRSWCTVVPGSTPFGSVIAVDAVVREELAMTQTATVMLTREMPTSSLCKATSSPVSCEAPPPFPCVAPLPMKATPCP